MKKVFISLVLKINNWQKNSLSFCSWEWDCEEEMCSVRRSGKLQTGENFIETIRQQMQECDTVISLITAEYLQSPFCLVEMGAAWALCKQYFPLLTVKYERIGQDSFEGNSDEKAGRAGRSECGIR